MRFWSGSHSPLFRVFERNSGGEFPASVYLPKVLAALSFKRRIEFNFRPECQAKARPPCLNDTQ
jgi:hypothetical protein